MSGKEERRADRDDLKTTGNVGRLPENTALTTMTGKAPGGDQAVTGGHREGHDDLRTVEVGR